MDVGATKPPSKTRRPSSGSIPDHRHASKIPLCPLRAYTTAVQDNEPVRRQAQIFPCSAALLEASPRVRRRIYPLCTTYRFRLQPLPDPIHPLRLPHGDKPPHPASHLVRPGAFGKITEMAHHRQRARCPAGQNPEYDFGNGLRRSHRDQPLPCQTPGASRTRSRTTRFPRRRMTGTRTTDPQNLRYSSVRLPCRTQRRSGRVPVRRARYPPAACSSPGHRGWKGPRVRTSSPDRPSHSGKDQDGVVRDDYVQPSHLHTYPEVRQRLICHRMSHRQVDPLQTFWTCALTRGRLRRRLRWSCARFRPR